MATDLSFVQYVCDQLRGAGVVTYRKMFGEYALYSDGRVVALLCDNQFFLKPTEAARALLGRAREGLPYPGARPHLLLDDALEDGELLSRLVALTAAAMPPPKPKTRSATASKPKTARAVQRKPAAKTKPSTSRRASKSGDGAATAKRAARGKAKGKTRPRGAR